MKHTAQITGNESVYLCTANRGAGQDTYEVTVFVTGGGGNNFDSGTVTIQASPDGGTTKVTLKDTGGNTVSITTDDVYNVKVGHSGKLGEEIELYATMAGSTSPTVDVTVFDNR